MKQYLVQTEYEDADRQLCYSLLRSKIDKDSINTFNSYVNRIKEAGKVPSLYRVDIGTFSEIATQVSKDYIKNQFLL